MQKEEILKMIEGMASEKAGKRLIIAIDGRCASGKTSLAEFLQKNIKCSVFHMDDFFLRPEQRTVERLREAGGNVDRERFYEEILKPLREGTELIKYRKFSCKEMKLMPETVIRPEKINIVEGSYSCHPKFFDDYDLRIALTISEKLQEERIIKRNGSEGYEIFKNKWIPLEEKYFRELNIMERADILAEL
ncbi:uridine kinase [Lachnospiraceae bacterium C1.1]|nr:uridine kinase [Lachnospiraceae bacterium C1.1]